MPFFWWLYMIFDWVECAQCGVYWDLVKRTLVYRLNIWLINSHIISMLVRQNVWFILNEGKRDGAEERKSLMRWMVFHCCHSCLSLKQKNESGDVFSLQKGQAKSNNGRDQMIDLVGVQSFLRQTVFWPFWKQGNIHIYIHIYVLQLFLVCL